MESDLSNRFRRHANGVLFQSETDSTVTYELENNSNSYGSGTISVTPQQNSDGYNVYRHTPSKISDLKTTEILYNRKKITLVNNSSINEQNKLDSLESNVFTEISTFVLKTKINEHLLLKLTTNKRDEYYLYRFGKDGTKWRQLGLKELLNFYVISREEFKEFEKSLASEKLSNPICKVIGSTVDKTKVLLEQISFEVNSFIVLLDKKDNYQKDKISSVLRSEEIQSVDDENRIFVNDDTYKDEGKCVMLERYKLYKQHLHALGDEEFKKHSEVFLRLYLFNNKIWLYEDPNGSGELVSLKYSKENKYLNVFFYDKDPRPLMLCYENKAYRPLDKENYFNKWIKVGEINGCDCKGNTENGPKLLRWLSETAYYMNPVEINHGLDRDKENGKYITQRFNHDGKEINVAIALFSEELNCYKAYDHDLGKESYILGEISYNGHKLFTNYETYLSTISSENKSESLGKIAAYYYMYDGGHKYPLMIELKYENNGYLSYSSDYYKLTRKDHIKKWIKIEETAGGRDKTFILDVKRIRNEMNEEMEKMMELAVSEESFELNEMETMSLGKEEKLTEVIERKLDEIRNDLQIEYVMTEENLIMSPSKCTKSSTGVVAGTVTTLGLVGTGSGILIYKYQDAIVSYLRSLFN